MVVGKSSGTLSRAMLAMASSITTSADPPIPTGSCLRSLTLGERLAPFLKRKEHGCDSVLIAVNLSARVVGGKKF